MGDDESGQMGFQQSSKAVLNCPSSGIFTSWDPMASLGQNGNFGGSSMSEFATSSSFPILLENQGISSSSNLVNYRSDPNLAHLLPKLPVFGSENFSEIASPFSLPSGIEKPLSSAAPAETDCQISEGQAIGLSPNGKRKRDFYPSPPNKNAEGDRQKDHSSETPGPQEQVDKKQKTEQSPTINLSVQQAGKQAQDNSEGEEASKQNYIHVRARRGQATNSHSLAERVRREKISERMRLLQELVPGCNKITGKAVMLDEIINYVQSLQQQVEFLSMKLATVNPELNFDIEQILSKDILHSRGSSASILGINQGMSSSHGLIQGVHQGILPAIPNAASQYHHLSQAVWDNSDLQSLRHMGFDSNPAIGSLGPNGGSKTEL